MARNISRYSFFANSDATAMVRRAARVSSDPLYAACKAARSYLLDRCFFSSPDGLWRRAGDKTVARIERRHDGFVVIARAAWEMQH